MYLSERMYFLVAGDLLVTQDKMVIKTTLGSCIAVSAWHPKIGIGGMCHYLLTEPRHQKHRKEDNFYGVHALNNLKKNLSRFAKPQDFHYGVFGGGSLLFYDAKEHHIAKTNIEYAKQWLRENSFRVQHESLGGRSCRVISLSLPDGDMNIKIHDKDSV